MKIEGPGSVETKPRPISWVKVGAAFALIILVGFGLSYLIQELMAKFHFSLGNYEWEAYVVVFVTSLISNLTILAPVPFAVSIMVAAATQWSPPFIALLAAVGGGIGEISGYYTGFLGRKIAIADSLIGRGHIEALIKRYGAFAIFIIAVQPIIPFDIGGLVAGAVKMPLHLFFPAIMAGRFIKYLILIYAGMGLINVLPFF